MIALQEMLTGASSVIWERGVDQVIRESFDFGSRDPCLEKPRQSGGTSPPEQEPNLAFRRLLLMP